jgi:hypothetical protein
MGTVSRLAAGCGRRWRIWFPTKLSDEELYAQLQTDVKHVQTHITDTFRHRKMFLDTTEMLRQHPTLQKSNDAAYWYDWLRTLYGHYIVMAVRRELDRGATSPNLYRLLRDVAKRPQVLSRARYKAFFDGSPLSNFGVDFGGQQFTEMAGSGAFIDPRIVRRDLKIVGKQSALVIRYADKIVAHRTPESVATTLLHVNESLEAIEEVLKKYYVLLTGNGLVGAEPSILHSWQEAFTVAWIPTDNG